MSNVANMFSLPMIRKDLCSVFTHITIGVFMPVVLPFYMNFSIPDNPYDFIMFEIPILLMAIPLILLNYFIRKVIYRNKIYNSILSITRQIFKILCSRFFEVCMYAIGVVIYKNFIIEFNFMNIFTIIAISYQIMIIANEIKSLENNLDSDNEYLIVSIFVQGHH